MTSVNDGADGERGARVADERRAAGRTPTSCDGSRGSSRATTSDLGRRGRHHAADGDGERRAGTRAGGPSAPLGPAGRSSLSDAPRAACMSRRGSHAGKPASAPCRSGRRSSRTRRRCRRRCRSRACSVWTSMSRALLARPARGRARRSRPRRRPGRRRRRRRQSRSRSASSRSAWSSSPRAVAAISPVSSARTLGELRLRPGLSTEPTASSPGRGRFAARPWRRLGRPGLLRVAVGCLRRRRLLRWRLLAAPSSRAPCGPGLLAVAFLAAVFVARRSSSPAAFFAGVFFAARLLRRRLRAPRPSSSAAFFGRGLLRGGLRRRGASWRPAAFSRRRLLRRRLLAPAPAPRPSSRVCFGRLGPRRHAGRVPRRRPRAAATRRGGHGPPRARCPAHCDGPAVTQSGRLA